MEKKQYQGQIVDRSSSQGMSVGQAWAFFFAQNEAYYEAKKLVDILTDEQLIQKMLEFFPFRTESRILYLPNKVRSRYNCGTLPGAEKPKSLSHRYRRGDDGAVTRVARRNFK